MVKRLTAVKARIAELVNGKYFPGSKEKMEPSYVITPLGRKVSRVNLVATVTDKFVSDDESYATLTLDDGSEAIRAKGFRDKVRLISSAQKGESVLVIGKVKEYSGELYVNAEVVRSVKPNYEILRKLEILKDLMEQKRVVDEIKRLKKQVSREELLQYCSRIGFEPEALETVLERKEIDYKPKILQVIESLDEGEGVEMSKLFEISDLPDHVIERAVDELLAEGEVYEPKVGILKKV